MTLAGKVDYVAQLCADEVDGPPIEQSSGPRPSANYHHHDHVFHG